MLENSAVNVLKIRCKHLKNVFKFCDALVCFNFSKTKCSSDPTWKDGKDDPKNV